MRFSHAGLRRRGFEGFRSVGELRSDHYRDVPKRRDGAGLGGVYVALCVPTATPRFNEASRRDEWTLPIPTLRDGWVDDSPVVYIGKADATLGGNSLHKRVVQGALIHAPLQAPSPAS